MRTACLCVCLLSAALLPAQAHAACDTITTADSLDAILSGEEKAFEALDLEAFSVSFQQMEQALPCMDSRVAQVMAARIHRMYGVYWFTQQNALESSRSFAAARVIEPGWTFPEAIAEGTSLRQAWEESLKITEQSTEAIRFHGTWLVDGVVSTRRPTSWPSVIQEERNGKIISTRYVLVGQPVVQEAPLVHPAAVPLTIATAGTALLASGLMLGAGLSHAEFDQPHAATDLYRLSDKTNVLGASGVGAGVLTLGLGAGAVVCWMW